MDLAVGIVAGILIGPFLVGYWIGNPLFAALVFVALSLTVALGTIARGDPASDPGIGLAFSLAISAVSAGAGGYLRAARRERRAPP